MAIESLILTITTCISSSFGNISYANKLKAIEENPSSFIQQFVSNYDLSSFDLTYEQQQSIMKQKLLLFNEENELIDDNYILPLKQDIINDSNYLYANNVERVFLKHDKTDFLYNDSNHTNFNLNDNMIDFGSNNLGGNMIVSNNSSGFDDTFGNNISSTFKYTTIDGNENSYDDLSKYELPILPYDSDNIKYSINEDINDFPFIGIKVSANACIAFYDCVANWLNKQVMYEASGVKGITRQIISEIKRIIGNPLSYVIGVLLSYFANIWNSLLDLLMGLSGPIGIVIGIIILIVGVLIISTIISMLIMGYQRKGFAVGWIIKGFWISDWEWYHGEI